MEQLAAMEECVAVTGLRLIEYLTRKFDLDARWPSHSLTPQ